MALVYIPGLSIGNVALSKYLRFWSSGIVSTLMRSGVRKFFFLFSFTFSKQGWVVGIVNMVMWLTSSGVVLFFFLCVANKVRS